MVEPGSWGVLFLLTWKRASYSPTILGWNISGLLCWVNGEASIVNMSKDCKSLSQIYNHGMTDESGEEREAVINDCLQYVLEQSSDRPDNKSNCCLHVGALATQLGATILRHQLFNLHNTTLNRFIYDIAISNTPIYMTRP